MNTLVSKIIITKLPEMKTHLLKYTTHIFHTTAKGMYVKKVTGKTNIMLIFFT